jgi:ribosome-binding factor A
MATRNRPSRRQLLTACSDPGPDDGTDPKDRPKHWNARDPGRKALQLSAQVAEALNAAFAESGDTVLADLLVTEVRPARHAGRMLVTVAGAPSAAMRSAAEVNAHLHGAAGWLRAQVAGAIHRRKTPELAFRVLSVA